MIAFILMMLQLPIAQPLPEPYGLPELRSDEWELVIEHATKHAKPVVLYIRCERRSVPGILSTRADSVWGHPGPTVLFGVPRNGKLAWFVAGPDWSVQDIESAVRYRLNERVSVQAEASEPDCPT